MDMQNIKKVAIIVAAGTGTRMGGTQPKQFHILGGRPLGIYCGLAFRRFNPEIELVYVIGTGTAQAWESLLLEHFPEGNWRLAMGGKTRYESVANGLRNVHDSQTLIAVHDAARPFISPDVIAQAFETAFEKRNAVVAVPAKDSIRMLNGHGSKALDRSQCFLVQTPQIFWKGDMEEIYRQPFDHRFTDDATVMELAGHAIQVVEGSYDNIKVTTPEDWILAEGILQRLRSQDLI